MIAVRSRFPHLVGSSGAAVPRSTASPGAARRARWCTTAETFAVPGRAATPPDTRSVVLPDNATGLATAAAAAAAPAPAATAAAAQAGGGNEPLDTVGGSGGGVFP